MPPPGQIAQLLAFVSAMSAGQVLFKKAAMSAPPVASLHGVLSLATNIWFILALAFYGVATLLWIMILQKIRLSVAYPFSAFGFILVPVAAACFFGEPLSPWYALGITLIVAGVVLVTLGA